MHWSCTYTQAQGPEAQALHACMQLFQCHAEIWKWPGEKAMQYREMVLVNILQLHCQHEKGISQEYCSGHAKGESHKAHGTQLTSRAIKGSGCEESKLTTTWHLLVSNMSRETQSSGGVVSC